MNNQGLDSLNHARAIRIAEIMIDFRNLQYYLAQLRATPTTEEYYLEGYSLLRQCTSEAQAIFTAPFPAVTTLPGGDPGGDAERKKAQFQSIIVDSAVRRFQCQRAYLRARAGLRWVNSRDLILRSQRPNASHFTDLQVADNALRMEFLSITDIYVESSLRSQDVSQGKWLYDDPTLLQIQQILMSR